MGGVGEDVGELSVNCGWGFSAVGFQPRQCNISVGQPQHEVRRFRHVSNFCTKSRTERAAALVVGPADFHVGRFDEGDLNPPHAEGGLYIVYYYRGAKVVQSILDTYPMGFPAAAAQQQVDRVIGALFALPQ